MSGDNPSGADNQQGRSPRIAPEYVAGFVDGEGCFSVSGHPDPTAKQGRKWLIAPCFQVYQLQSNVGILERIQEFFGCGAIRAKGPNSNVMTYSVYRRQHLASLIIPFFDAYPLQSGKQDDFRKFREIVLAMNGGEHRTETGFRWIVERAFSMNQRGKQRKYCLTEVLAKPSETARQAPAQLELVKIQSDPCGDTGRAAEMTAPPSLIDEDGSNKNA